MMRTIACTGLAAGSAMNPNQRGHWVCGARGVRPIENVGTVIPSNDLKRTTCDSTSLRSEISGLSDSVSFCALLVANHRRKDWPGNGRHEIKGINFSSSEIVTP